MITDIEEMDDLVEYIEPWENEDSWTRLTTDERTADILGETLGSINGIREALNNPEKEREDFYERILRSSIEETIREDPEIDEETEPEEIIDRIGPSLNARQSLLENFTTTAEEYGAAPEELGMAPTNLTYIHQDGQHRADVKLFPDPVTAVEAELYRNEDIPTEFLNIQDYNGDSTQTIINRIEDERRRIALEASEHQNIRQDGQLIEAAAPFHFGEKWSEVADVMDTAARKDEDNILFNSPSKDNVSFPEIHPDEAHWLADKQKDYVDSNKIDFIHGAAKLGKELAENNPEIVDPEYFGKQTRNQAFKLDPEIEETFEYSFVGSDGVSEAMKHQSLDVLRKTAVGYMDGEFTEEHREQTAKADNPDGVTPEYDEAELREYQETQDSLVFDSDWARFLETGELREPEATSKPAREAGIGDY